jgi:5-methylcytosine-specific restriction endonuclease McrA
MTKECDICGSEFDGHGLAKRCSDKCKREVKLERNRKWRAANRAPAAIKECDVCGSEFEDTSRAGNAKRCSDKCRQESQRERYAAKRETILEYRREYSKTPAGKASKRRRRHRRRDAPCNGSIKHFQLADKCVRCGSTENLELEHITPISQGGSNHIENLTTMCAECNHGVGGKHTKGPHDWATFVAWYLWNE